MRLPEPVMHDAAWLRTARRRLLAWYGRHARDLPWRQTSDPYHVWLSEIMLQQTQVATVIPYFERFISALPTVASLAAAPEEQVLRLWEGLGYYRRARQLHRAAQVIVAEHGGVFPRAFEAVLALPGIGRYTAGAIVSIAFDTPAPILEANTIRLFSRLWRFAGDTADRAGQKFLWGAAEALLPRRGAGELNQAFMELGSQVCLPRVPRCAECPLAELCPTHQGELYEVIPRPKQKPAATEVRHLLLVVRRGKQFLLRKANPGDRWAGLWDFPRFEAASEQPVDELLEGAKRQLGQSIEIGEKLTTLRHTVTRYRITLDCHEAHFSSGSTPHAPTHEQRWFRLEELENLPLNTTGRKVVHLLMSEAD